jgi:hypothetical protein
MANAGEVDTVEWVPVRELATRVPGDSTQQFRNIWTRRPTRARMARARVATAVCWTAKVSDTAAA